MVSKGFSAAGLNEILTGIAMLESYFTGYLTDAYKMMDQPNCTMAQRLIS
ncbi:hypothetical protein [Pantoea alhagi]|nr:hypothetical protein [Pantoea alhagi]